MGPPVMTLWVVQIANVAGEEARQFLNEIDFSTHSFKKYKYWGTHCTHTTGVSGLFTLYLKG